MRTVPFKSIYYGVASRLGLTPNTTDGIDAARGAEIVQEINNWVQEGWDYDWWPEAMVTVERDVTTAADSVRYVPYVETDEISIGSVLRLDEANPLVSGYSNKLPFTLNANGVVVNDAAPDSVFVQFRRRAPQFTHLEWDSGITYAIGDVVYYATAGECYIAIVAGKDKNPVAETTYWTKVDFPVWLRTFVLGIAYAYGLREQEQETTRIRAEDRAYDHLARSAAIELNGQNQFTIAQRRDS